VGAAERFRTGFGKAEMQHLSLRDQILDRAGHVFDRDCRVDAVLVEEIDPVGPQPLQHAVNRRAYVLGAAIEATLRPVSGSMSQPNFEEIATRLRNGATASPTIRSTSSGP
jgi:hypothetical protein